MEPLLRQLFGKKCPDVTKHKAHRRTSPSSRELFQPILPLLKLDEDLRPHARGWVEGKRPTALENLTVEQRRRLCAVGYLLLVAILAFQEARARACTNKHVCAKLIAEELARAALWIYGTCPVKPIATLAELVGGGRLDPSSIRLMIDRLEQEDSV
jgi:hypothetical protein